MQKINIMISAKTWWMKSVHNKNEVVQKELVKNVSE